MTDYVKTIRKRVGHDLILLCGASVIVVNDSNQILLQLRKDNACWCYAGGSVEPDEPVEEAARRELYEETGLSALKLSLYGVFSGPGQHYVYPNNDEVSIIDIVYVCSDYTGQLKPDADEVSSLRFFDPGCLPENLSPPADAILRQFASELLSPKITIKPIDLSIRELVTAFIIKHWYSDTMMIRGEKIDMTAVDGFAAFDEAGHEIKGLITYIIRNDICEITSLDSVQEKKGIGTALIETVSESAKKAGCRLLRLLTTNDNLNAIGFYQKRGFELMGINRGAIDYERLTKPEIPLVGQNNIPIHHEIEFAMML